MAIVGEAHIVVRAITLGFKNDVEDSLKSVNGSFRKMGEKSGRDFSNGISKGSGGGKNPFDKLTRSAEDARKKFNSLIKTGYALGPAIAGAAGAIGDLVFGLFSIGAAAGAAAPALVVLPGLLSAVAQAGIAAKLAFMGVGKAVSALLKQKTGGGGGSSDNSKQIADARKALARAYQSAADQMAAANDKVRKAQNALNKAYEKGAESLQQLGFDAEDAAIAQGKAAIELERAKETLARVQDLPADNRARRDAELAFQEADLNYRQAVDRSNDLAKAQAYAKETGIEGTQEVLGAKEDLADAEADLAKTQRDNAQSIADAQENLQNALKKTKDVATSVADPLAGLPKSAADFALFIAGLKPEFDKLRAAAADGLFPKLTTSIQNLVTNLFPHLIPILYDTSSAIGDVAIKFSDMLTKSENLDRIDRIFGDTNVKVIEDLGGAAVNLGEAFLIILDAARPLVEKFSEWVKLTSDGWLMTLKAKDATGELTDIFNNSGEAAATIGGALGSAGGAFFELGKSAKDAGLKIIKAFGGAMDKLKEFAQVNGNDGMFSEGVRGASTLETKFDNIATNFITIGKFAGEMAKALFDVSGNPGITAFFERIMGLPAVFSGLADNINTVMGAKFGDFVNQLGTLIANLTETGGMSIFFSILTGALKVVNTLFSNPVIAAAFSLLAAIKGIVLAFSVLGAIGGFAGKVVLGTITKITSMTGALLAYSKAGYVAEGTTSKIMAQFRMLGAMLGISLGPFLAIVAAIAALAFIVYEAYKNSEIFRTAVTNLVTAVGGALNDAMATINDAIKQVMPSFTGISDIFKTIGDYIGTYLVPFFQVILVGAINTFAGVISGAIKILGGFWKLFSDPIAGIKLILSGFVDFFKAMFITPITNMLKIADIFGLLPDGFKSAINRMIRMWNNFELELKIPDNAASQLLGIAGKGFTISTPNVPLLAKGGIIQPTYGGTLARIGEAGRPERVEPLDPDGLSVRDRAIIAELSAKQGGSGKGLTFNIYPSQGMNEVDLANMVSRKVAWTLKRGAA